MVMEAQPSPQSVGREFVRQYYTLLNKAPDHLHRFYNNSSSFVHGGLDSKNQEATLVIGQVQIHNKIQQMNFRDCHAKISQVDSQATLGNGVVVQVTGELSNDGQPMRRFTQTFVLAAQSPKKYYVHNDIFRYQDVYSDDELDENERSGGEDEADVDNSAAVENPNIPSNVVTPGATAPIIGHQPQQQAPQQPQQQQQQQQQLYYPPGVVSAPAGLIPNYGQPQQAQQPQQQPQQQLNGVHDDLLKPVPPQTATHMLQSSTGHPPVGQTVPLQANPILQQVPGLTNTIPTVDSIQHLSQQQPQQQQIVQQSPQQYQPQPVPQQLPTQTTPQQQQQQQQQPSIAQLQLSDPEPSLSMNELDTTVSSVNDPTPAEASDSQDHHHHHHHGGHVSSDLSDPHQSSVQPMQQQQQLSNEPKTYANLLKSGGAGVVGTGPLSFASVSSHHQQQQQQQQQQQTPPSQQPPKLTGSYMSASAGRQTVMSPPPSSGLQSSITSGGPGSATSGGSNLGGLGVNKYDRQPQQQQQQGQQQQQQQQDLGGNQNVPMPQRVPNQQRPIRSNGGPPSNSGPNSYKPQQDGRPSYQRSYNNDNEDRRQNSSAQFGDNHQLFLGNIPHHATEEELKTLFSRYGTVVDLRIHSKAGQKMPGVRAPPNYGFLTYDDPAAVQNCLANMPLYFPENSPDGQKLNVEEKKTRMRGPGETGGRIGSNGNGGSGGPRGGPGGPGSQQRGGPGGPPGGNMNRGGSGQRGLGGVGGGSGRGGYQRSDRGSVSGGGGGGGGGQRSGNGNYHQLNR
ncbi:ras GTPase-activating protein-binding protein 2 isoform X2 [Sabethes cyaneus]|uniref:ras GTPase-activating protein-binding protein 2 isoform X2 n=1 Tax=Sabethes cyaneus TaxID=53552 RepID=UPI00221E3582|nr:ras GTPase-activating protein-binding protein 2 isoform X2 [Sabethes cyaneus]